MNPHRVAFGPEHPAHILYYASGRRDTQRSLDTLKKEYDALPRVKSLSKEGFWQVLPLRAVGGPAHLSWAVFSVLSGQQSNTLHFRQPELELLARVAGTFQWDAVKGRAGLTSANEGVVVVWVGPPSELSLDVFARVAKKWGLRMAPWKIPRARDAGGEAARIEATALAGLD